MRFDFTCLARQRLNNGKAAPDRLAKIQETFRQQVALETGHCLMITGGKSILRQVACLLLDELEVLGGIDLHLHHDCLGDQERGLLQGHDQERHTVDLKAAKSNLLADKNV